MCLFGLLEGTLGTLCRVSLSSVETQFEMARGIALAGQPSYRCP